MENDGHKLIKHPKLIDYDDVPPALVPEARAMIEKQLSATEEAAAPMLIHLCGIPASGKSTYAEQSMRDRTNFALVQFDGVMSSLPGYQADCASRGLTKAFKTWELPARAIGYHLLQALLEHRRNVFFDHTAAFRTHLALIDGVKAWGYRFEMHYLKCPPEVALERLQAREALIQRHTPSEYVWQRQALLAELIPIYKKKADRFIIIVNDDAKVEHLRSQ